MRRGHTHVCLPPPLDPLPALLVRRDRPPLPPFRILAVPGDGLGESGVEIAPGPPPQLALGLLEGHGVAPVVPRPVGDERDQLFVRADLRDDPADDLDVLPLGRAAEVVDLAGPPVLEGAEHAAAVVLDVDPVPSLASISVDGEG